VAASGSIRSTLGPWPAYKEILQNVIAIGGGQLLLADRALKHLVACAGVRLHPNDLVTRLAMRASKFSGNVASHSSKFYHLIPSVS
jgi:hypothetical protein